MNTVIRDTISRLMDAKNQMKALDKEIRDLTEVLKAEHAKCGKDTFCVDGYISSISHACRQVLLKENIEKLLGHEIPADCIKLSPYDVIRTSNDPVKAQQLITESKAIEL